MLYIIEILNNFLNVLGFKILKTIIFDNYKYYFILFL